MVQIIEIERLGIYGEGVGRLDGLTVFVEGALPGETVAIEITERRAHFSRARIIKRLVTSSDRREPMCPLFGTCGGCQLMHLSYDKQLEEKRKRVEDALVRIGKISCPVLPCLPSPTPFAYRNKIQLPVQNGLLGMYAHNSHDFVPVEQCFIHGALGEKVHQALKKSIQKVPLKYLLIKTAIHTQQALVIFVTARRTPALKEIAHKVMQEVSEVRGVVEHVNPHEGNTILSGQNHILAGQGWIEERLLELTFKISPHSFFQVNPLQAENLYKKVVEFSALTGDEIVLDAYCGVGTLALILAQHAQKVVGIECVSQAILDARENAQINGIKNVEFITGRAEQSITLIKHVDVAILNPPRKGCDPAFLTALCLKTPQRIVYVSCDPATLARDLALLCAQGYQLKTVQPFDMFPQTAHVETIAELIK